MVEPYLQEHATIYGHQIFHYLIASTIGNIHIVQYEGKGMELHETIVMNDYSRAEKLFKRYCRDMVDGKYL